VETVIRQKLLAVYQVILMKCLKWLTWCRYVVAALLVSKPEAEDPRDKWRSRCNAVKRIIQSEEYQYSDPLTDFAKAVFIDFDFDRAQEQLQACQEIIANDYFLAEVNAKFTEKARMAIFEVYCRIHQRINLDALAAQVSTVT
jgi:translation initiation factor 3 subunit E